MFKYCLFLFFVIFFLPPKNCLAAGHIFSDSSFTTSTNKFSPGQTVYLRVQAFSDGSERNLRLLDSNKNQIKQMQLAQNGNLYEASFPAPEDSGVYYVDIRISNGLGSVFSSQENINVGEGGSSASSSVNTVINSSNQVAVNSEAQAKIEGEGKVTVNGQTYTSNSTPKSPTPTPTESVTTAEQETQSSQSEDFPQSPKSRNVFVNINKFLADLYLKLTNLF